MENLKTLENKIYSFGLKNSKKFPFKIMKVASERKKREKAR